LVLDDCQVSSFSFCQSAITLLSLVVVVVVLGVVRKRRRTGEFGKD